MFRTILIFSAAAVCSLIFLHPQGVELLADVRDVLRDNFAYVAGF